VTVWGEQLEELRYADDTALITESEEKLTALLGRAENIVQCEEKN